VPSKEGPLAIDKSNVDILTKEDIDAKGSKGYEIESKGAPVKIRSGKKFLANIKTVSTLLSDVKAKFPELSDVVDKIEEGIIQGRYNQIEATNELNKELNKVRKNAGVTAVKLALRPAAVIMTEVNGAKTPLTNDAIVDLYMTYKAEGAKRLEQTGVDIEALKKYMSTQPKLRQFADDLLNFYDKKSERFREIYEKIMRKDWDLIRLDPEGNKKPYMPIYGTGAPGYNDFTATEQGLTEEGLQPSSLDNKSNNPMVSHFFDKNSQFQYNEKTGEYEAGGGSIRPEGATTKATDWIESMTHTENMYEVYEDVQKLINSDTKMDLVKELGRAKYNELVKRIHRSLNPQEFLTSKEAGKETVQALNQLQISWMIGSKLSAIPKQLTSTVIWLGAGVDLGVYPQDVLAQTINPKNLSKENLTFIYELMTSPQLKERILRSSIDPSLKNLLYKKSTTGLTPKDLNALTRLYVKLALSPTMAGDYLGVTTLGVPFALAYKAKLRKKTNPQTGKLYTEAEAADAAKRKFYELTNKYQQSSETWASSSLSESQFGKLVVMPYKSAQSAIYNGYARNINILKQAAKDPSSVSSHDKAQATLGTIFLFAAQAGFTSVSSGFLVGCIRNIRGRR